MPRKVLFILTNFFGLMIALLILWTNNTPVHFQFFGNIINISLGLLLLCTYLIGTVIGTTALVLLASGTLEKNVSKLKEWQHQDVKLIAEIHSDREKQLEAKIITLESALKQALKNER